RGGLYVPVCREPRLRRDPRDHGDRRVPVRRDEPHRRDRVHGDRPARAPRRGDADMTIAAESYGPGPAPPSTPEVAVAPERSSRGPMAALWARLRRKRLAM